MNVSPFRTSKIVKYSDETWEVAGNLRQVRHGHGAISLGGITMVLGGYPAKGET